MGDFEKVFEKNSPTLQVDTFESLDGWRLHITLSVVCFYGVEKPAESAKERAAREAREKKEKAQELLRKREAEEAAQNLGIL